MSKLYLFIKGIKKNALNNAIDVKKKLWLNNVYIYVWSCSMDAFDNIIYHMRILKDLFWVWKQIVEFQNLHFQIFEFQFLGSRKINFFGQLVALLYSLGLKFVTQSAIACVGNNYANKHIKFS